ncbi:MAG: hypothetical protein HWD59_00720 [Coxiellaceae bacterium]|nr:MAG: hypothetical protein HWD59_00720 [Coxiellaceae bacterium]
MSLITGADLAKNMFMEETISEIAEELFSEIIQELKEINESTIMQFKSHLNDDHFHYKIGYEPSTLYREDTRHDTTKISEKT